MFKKILVPLDGSKLSERALGPALALAQQVGGEVILLSVPVLKHMFVMDKAGHGLLLPDDSRKDSQRELTEYLQTVVESQTHPEFTLRTKVIDGDEASVIVDTAVAENIDLIVMSTHGRSGFQHWLLGSITERVLHSAPCPVLIVRSSQPISRVLFPLDGSELAKCALEPGFEIAAKLGCQATLFNVIEHFYVSTADADRLESVEAGLGRQLEESLFTKNEAYLQIIKQRYEQMVDQEIHIALAEGPTAKRILGFAENWNADLIVMATHGRTGLRRWLYGSVTEKVLRGAHCHMLVIRPPDHQLN